MSKPVQKDLVCECGKSFTALVYKSANVTLDPGLGLAIAEGRFNVVECPSCSRRWSADVPFLYHDMEAPLAVWVYPVADAPRAAEIRARLQKVAAILSSSVGESLDGESAGGGSGTRLVFGLDALRDELDR